MAQGALPVPVAVVDDHSLVRDQFAELIRSWPRGQLALLAADGIDLEEQLAHTPPPALALVDLSMPRRDGYATIAWLRAHTPTLPLALTHDPHPHAVDRALHAGACTVLGKGVLRADLYRALEHVADTGFHASFWVQESLRRGKAASEPDALRRKALATLSPRELQFAELYTSEAEPTLEQVAKAMHVSPHTAEDFRKKVVEKTGARTRTALLRFMLRFGLGKW